MAEKPKKQSLLKKIVKKPDPYPEPPAPVPYDPPMIRRPNDFEDES